MRRLLFLVVLLVPFGCSQQERYHQLKPFVVPTLYTAEEMGLNPFWSEDPSYNTSYDIELGAKGTELCSIERWERNLCIAKEMKGLDLKRLKSESVIHDDGWVRLEFNEETKPMIGDRLNLFLKNLFVELCWLNTTVEDWEIIDICHSDIKPNWYRVNFRLKEEWTQYYHTET